MKCRYRAQNSALDFCDDVELGQSEQTQHKSIYRRLFHSSAVDASERMELNSTVNVGLSKCSVQWAAECFQVPPIISGTGKATDFLFGQYIHRVHPNIHNVHKAIKILVKGNVGVSRGCPNFLGTPLLSQELVKLRTANLAGIFAGPSEQKPIKNFGEKGRDSPMF